MNPSDFGADIFDSEGEPSSPVPAKGKKTKRKTRSRRSEATAEPDAAAEPDAEPEAPTEPVRAIDTAPVATDPPEPGEDEGRAAQGTDEPAGDERPTKKRRRRRTRGRRDGAEDPADDPADAEVGTAAGDVEPAPVDEDRADAERDDEDRRAYRHPWRAADDDDEAEPRFDATDDDAPTSAPDFDARDDRDEADADREDGDEGESRGGRRRRRRRRRGGRGEPGDVRRDDDAHRDDEIRRPRDPAADAEEERAGTAVPRRTRHRTGRMIPVPTPEGEIRGARVAVLMNLERLVDDAREQGGEVAYGKLLQFVARRRHLIRAIAYAQTTTAQSTAPTLRGSGVETQAIGTPSDLPVAIAVDAMALATRVDSVVLVPDAEGLAPLTAALRAHGIRVETAGFGDPHGGPGTGDDDPLLARHRLGDESLFQP